MKKLRTKTAKWVSVGGDFGMSHENTKKWKFARPTIMGSPYDLRRRRAPRARRGKSCPNSKPTRTGPRQKFGPKRGRHWAQSEIEISPGRAGGAGPQAAALALQDSPRHPESGRPLCDRSRTLGRRGASRRDCHRLPRAGSGAPALAADCRARQARGTSAWASSYPSSPAACRGLR